VMAKDIWHLLLNSFKIGSNFAKLNKKKSL